MFSGNCLSDRPTRRGWLASAALGLASACGRKKGTGFPGYALIANRSANSVAIVDLTTFRLIKTLPLKAAPTAVIPSRSPNSTFVLTPDTGTIHVIDADLNVAHSARPAPDISEVRLSADGSTLIAISKRSREIVQLDAANLSVLQRRKLGGEPVSVDVSADGLAAVSTAGGSVELLDLNGKMHKQAQISGTAGTLCFRSDGKLLLVANTKERCLSALTAPSLEFLADLSLAMEPNNLCFSADRGQLFVSGEGMDAVAIVFPFNMLEVDQTVLAGRNPGVMACSSSPAYLFVANDGGSDICILNIETRKVVAVVGVGQSPSYITTTPDNQYALVLDHNSGDMAVIRIPEIQVNLSDPFKLRYKAGASLFTMLPVGDGPVHAAVVPRRA